MSRGSDNATGIKATQFVATNPEHSPKFEITGRHIPEQPLNDHTNYFAALEDDDDETMATSNVSQGYFGEDNIGMDSGILTKHDETPAHILHTTTPICDLNCEKPEQINKMVTPIFFRTANGQKMFGIPL